MLGLVTFVDGRTCRFKGRVNIVGNLFEMFLLLLMFFWVYVYTGLDEQIRVCFTMLLLLLGS